jgi:antitoxin component of RelBE/YafQ-DinJ toxin-antitoxin module
MEYPNDHQLHVRVSQSSISTARKKALSYGLTLSAVIRVFIEEFARGNTIFRPGIMPKKTSIKKGLKMPAKKKPGKKKPSKKKPSKKKPSKKK